MTGPLPDNPTPWGDVLIKLAHDAGPYFWGGVFILLFATIVAWAYRGRNKS